MPNIEQKALDLVEHVYAAAVDKQKWSFLIAAISDAVDGQGGMLRLTDYTNQKVGFFETVGYDAGYTQAYREHFITLDPYREFFEHTPIGTLSPANQFPNYRQVLKGEFHNDYLRPQNKEYLAGATLARDGDTTIQFALHRSKQAGDFNRENMQLPKLLLPHIVKAIQIQRLIGETANRADLAFACMDQARIAIFLMDANGNLKHHNREAENLLTTGELSVKHKQLILDDPKATTRLQQLIDSATIPSLAKRLECGGELNVVSAEGRITLELRVIPLSGRETALSQSNQTASAAVFVSRPGTLRLPWQEVASTYGLTPAEAKLAVLLAEGYRLEDAADQLAVSLNTIRTQMKSIFAKTGIRRQPELVATLLGGVLAWCNNNKK